MYRVLVIGKSSYIGRHILDWLSKDESFSISSISIRGDEWKNINYSDFDTIINVAGIAHVKIKVNTEMAVDICREAKRNSCRQYIYLSSMNVYGDTSQEITENVRPCPKNFYGDSKLQADNQIQQFNSDTFSVVSIRPPVVYGKGCKGNFPKLAKLAKITPLFPKYDNTRSILYIDNLCELVKLLIIDRYSGIVHPQNKEKTSTVQMVEIMAKIYGRHISMPRFFNPFISLMVNKVHLVNRMFADDHYSRELSNIFDYRYCVYSTEESIERSL